MDNNIDLNFLNECEVSAIVNVIEKDFELKAAEKSRLCRLRKKMIKNDQRAVELSQTNFDGFGCVICFKKFVFLINPKRICCSCGLQICDSCCQYMKTLENYVCYICQQQKDLIAMNCSWFYENIRRKFMDGGSQIVANSLSDYPRKNLISPTILNMVKGTQITKFRLQVEEATRTIEESLVKVELSFQEKELKSIKFAELIQKFVDTLKQILRTTSQVLYITMENYLFKIGKQNTNIDLEVFGTLHEEVELLTGRKIDTKMFKRHLLKGRIIDYDNENNLETILSMPILDKLLCDVQQSLLEGQGKKYDDLNSTLQSLVKKSKYDSLDYEFESISQVPSRHGTVRRSVHLVAPQPTLFECSQNSSTESLESSSRLYSMSGVGNRSASISKQWNQLVVNNSNKIPGDYNQTLEDDVTLPVISNGNQNAMPIDSDAVSMHTVSDTLESNWMMKARCPLGSLNSLYVENCSPYGSGKKRRQSTLSKTDLHTRSISIEEKMDQMCQESHSILSDSNTMDIEEEYSANLKYRTSMPNLNKNNKCNGSAESQDSGIVAHVQQKKIHQPIAPSRKSRSPKSTATIVAAPQIPTRKNRANSKTKVELLSRDSSSNSSIDNERKHVTLSRNQKRNLSDQIDK